MADARAGGTSAPAGTVGSIGPGVLVYLGVLRGDDEACARRLAQRVLHFRFFSDESGRMNVSLVEVGGAALVVSQVTLAADGKKGRRPSLDAAAPPAEAEALYGVFVDALRSAGVSTETGAFGTMMDVAAVNAGPVTFVFDEPRAPPGETGQSSQVLA